MDRRDFAAAQRLAAGMSADDPLWGAGQYLLGEAARRAGDVEAARKHFRAIPRDGTPASLSAALELAHIAEATGRLNEAITHLAYLLEHEPHEPRALGRIAELCAATGQRSRADRYLRELVRTPDLGFKQLVLLTDFERRHPQAIDFLKQCEEQAPDDPAINLGLAVEDIGKSDFASARTRLERAVATEPELGAAQALLGELLLDDGDEAMCRWHGQLPESVRQDAEIWYVRGLWAQQCGEREIAARCFWECVREVPHSLRALYQLGQVMTDLDPDVGRAYAERAQLTYELRQRLSDMLNSGGRNEEAMRRVIELLLESGREWEAWSWAITAHQRYAGPRWVAPMLEQLGAYPETEAPRVVDARNLTAVHDLSHYPEFDRFQPASVVASPADESSAARIGFVNDAARCGFDFVYHQGRVPEMVGVRMQESTGGGIGVLDYDADGRPDLYLTQGEDWPRDSDVPADVEQYQDRLFRNHGGGFRETTALAWLPSEGGFGQGCCAGDFDDDGFVDLYVANIGANQLLLNNGDGTYRDVTGEFGITPRAWTSSCLIADVNADGYADLLDVNYVRGEMLYRMICDEHECSPQAYDSAPDALHLSQGDGALRSLELVGSLGTERGGAGLAVVAFRAGARPASAGVPPALTEAARDQVSLQTASPPGLDPRRLAVFIANDQEPNFFFVNAPADNLDGLLLTECGFLSGLAVNKDGRTTACMGVASGDLNGDRLLDLFVTNYKGEANNLYVQSAGGWFHDAIGGTGLMAPGVPYVGWGTQFLDADNDGRLDLVVANGHVGDFREPGVEYAMPTQLFRNRGDGTFEEQSPSRAGPFFAERLYGRSLATIDWNQDGLTDFVLSPIASPVALLTNETEEAGNYLAVRLRAKSTARDAIGAFVTVVTEEGELEQQLTAGDGYQATNERVVRFGMGRAERIERVVIEWPAGVRQAFENVPVNARLDVVEGVRRATVWTGRKPGSILGQSDFAR